MPSLFFADGHTRRWLDFRRWIAVLAGKYTIIKDDQVVSVWDTLGDALQAAGERFGSRRRQATVSSFSMLSVLRHRIRKRTKKEV
jgi:hypothetical protein